MSVWQMNMRGKPLLLRDLLEEIGKTYRRQDGMSTAAQDLLRAASVQVLRDLLPVGYVPKGSGGQGSAAVTPWIAIFDDDETGSAQQGMYVVYLFGIEQRTVSLTLIQGVTALKEQFGQGPARALLRQEAAAIRDEFEAETIADLDSAVELGANNELTVNYEHGNILARTYQIDALPSNDELVADLDRFIGVYAQALDARRDARERGRSKVQQPTKLLRPKKQAAEFRPKSDGDVRRFIRNRVIRVELKHETLVGSYGQYLRDNGFVVATNVHPRDFTAERAGQHWLFEAKTVKGSAISAARDALSQLYFYERFLYEPDDSTRRAALFNQPIGPPLVSWLQEHDIAVVWKEHGRWIGTHPDLANVS